MTTNNDTAATVILTADDATANALVATIRAAVNGAGKYAAYVEAHDVTRDNVKDHARALASLAYPNDEPVQKKDGARTRYGNAVQAAGNGLRAALASDDTADDDRPVNLLTRAGLAATLEEVTAAWTAAQA